MEGEGEDDEEKEAMAWDWNEGGVNEGMRGGAGRKWRRSGDGGRVVVVVRLPMVLDYLVFVWIFWGDLFVV